MLRLVSLVETTRVWVLNNDNNSGVIMHINIYITKKLHRLELFESKHPLFVYKYFFVVFFCSFFFNLCLYIKSTFPASASRIVDFFLLQLNINQPKKRKKMEYKKESTSPNQLICSDMLRCALSPFLRCLLINKLVLWLAFSSPCWSYCSQERCKQSSVACECAAIL